MPQYQGTERLIPGPGWHDGPPTLEDLRILYRTWLPEWRTEEMISRVSSHVKECEDGRAFSPWECRMGQLDPNRCATCRKSWCWWCSGRQAMLRTKRNARGILLPVKIEEKLDPLALQWSALSEIVNRIESRYAIRSCVVCQVPLVDGLKYPAVRLQRTRQERRPSGIRYLVNTDHGAVCGPRCLEKVKSRNVRTIFSCTVCGRFAVVDTVSLEATRMCHQCLKRFILKHGLVNDGRIWVKKKEIDIRPLWSFSIRAIQTHEAKAAGFKLLSDGPVSSTRYVYLPTDVGVYVRKLGYLEKKRHWNYQLKSRPLA